MTSKFLNGTYVAGYALTGVYTEITIGAAGSIGGFGLIGGSTAAYAIVNLGRAAATVANADGIRLLAGGGITNGSTSDTTALIAGGPGGAGIALTGDGWVDNQGTIVGGAGKPPFGGDDGGAGVRLTGAGGIANSRMIIGGDGGPGLGDDTSAFPGIGGSGGAALQLASGSVSNVGTIVGGEGGFGTGASGNGGDGITMSGRGSIGNAGIIIGGFGPGDGLLMLSTGRGGDGIRLSAGGNLSNTGLIAGGNSGNYSGGDGVVLAGSGGVDNWGTIVGGNGSAGGAAGVRFGGTGGVGIGLFGGSVANSGTVLGGSGADAKTDTSSGGAGGTGIALSGAPGSVANLGFVAGGRGGSGGGKGGAGVALAAGGILDNWGTIAGGTGSPGAAGVVLSGGGSVHNWGTIAAGGAGPGIALSNGGSIDNWGTIVAGSYGGGDGIRMPAGGSVDNRGRISGGRGAGAGITLSATGSVNNSGTVSGGDGAGPSSPSNLNGGAAVVLSGGGEIANSGVITGGGGGTQPLGLVGNGGAGGSAIALPSGGTVKNSGAIIGGPGGVGWFSEVHDGILVRIENHGPSGTGIGLTGGGTIINGPGTGGGTALISGRIGVEVLGSASATVANFGTIASLNGTDGTAVSFAAAGSLLILEGGSRLVGKALGAGGTLELAAAGGTGAVTGFGSQYLNFGSLVFDSGAKWTVEGSASGMPGTITGFDLDDAIDVDGFVAVSDSYNSSGLILTDALGKNVTISLQGDFTTGDFLVIDNGHGGTAITITTIPTRLALLPATDSGIKGDNVTNVMNPVITGVGKAGRTLTLFDGAITVGTATVDGADTWSVTTSTLTEGSHTLTATETDGVNTSGPSAPLSLTIDTTGVAPSGLTLDPASDSGTKGDNSTTVTTPVITGTGEAGATLTLLDGATSVGTTNVDKTGTWSVKTSALAVGKHTLTATEIDVAGNTSPASAALTLTIETGGAGGPPITGTAGDDTLTGTAGVDTISGGAGNDVLIGLGGADTLDGGPGIDTADYSKDAANGGLDSVVVDLSKTFKNLDGFGATDVLISIENLIGTNSTKFLDATTGKFSTFGDVLIGDGGPNVINGLGGPDYIDGGDGNDTLFGGDGNDAIVGRRGDDYVDGGNGDDTILLGDYLHPTATDGNDIGIGGAGNDLLWGYGGDDTLFGGDGDDTLVGNDFASAQSGNDTMFGGNGDDTFFVGIGGSATMDGGAGNDNFYGGAGNDVMIGGAGSDFMYGAGGADTFIFHAADLVSGDADIVYFFSASDGDTLQFDASLQGQLTMTDTTLTDFQSGASVASVFITNNAGWSAAVYGINFADLSAHTVFI